MKKSQSFGFDLLVIIISVILFSQVAVFSLQDFPKDYFFQRNIENNELLKSALMKDNSLALLDCHLMFNDDLCLDAFNESITSSLKEYLGSRNYLLQIGDLEFARNESHKCFKKAIPLHLELELPSGNVSAFFSIYLDSEVIDEC